MKNKPKTLKPKLRFPEFRDAGAWELRRLSDLLIERKQRNRQLKYGPEDVLSVSGEYGCVNQIELLGRSYAGVSVKDYHVVETGDIVYTKSPLKQNPFGIIKENKGRPGIVSTLYAVYCATSMGHPAFLHHYFSRDYSLNSYLQPIVRKGAKNDMKVNNSAVLGGEIFAPSVEEQQKIADFLTSLDEWITAEGRKLEALRAHKKGLMRQLFPREGENRPRLCFPEFRDGPPWTPHPLDKFVVRSFYGTSNSTSAKGQYPVLRMGNMIDGGLDVSKLVYIDLDDEEFESIRLMDGDILLNRTNSMDLVGKISIFRLPGNYISASYIVTYRLDADRLDPQFCNLMLNTPQYQKQIKALARPSVSQANINPTTFRKELIIAVPPLLAEQQRIAACFSWLDALIAAQSRKVDGLRAHKEGLMQQVFPSPEGV